jgi:hypothetical protein
MSKVLYTVDNLVEEVRSLTDEQNLDSVDTTLDILPALNRAQDVAFDIYARKYPEPILTNEPLVLVNGQQEYTIPESVFEDRILKIEIFVPSGSAGTYRDIQRISYRDISNYESASKTNIPYYYAIYGRKIRFVAQPTGTFNARIWYLRNPEKLVLPQGRVTFTNTENNYIIVDSVGPDLTTESDQLNSYVNVVDGQTGEIKTTLQIASIQENKITFRSVGVRGAGVQVLNRTIAGSFTSAQIAPDDYICAIDGICVPYYGRPTSNFLIAHAVKEIAAIKLGGEIGAIQTLVDTFEKQVERTWVGREKQMRIQKRSQNWGVPTRRWYFQ